MSLVQEDLLQIRNIVQDVIKRELEPILGKIETLENDIKEIYEMLADVQKSLNESKHLKNLTVEDKILKIHSDLVSAAKQAGVTLPNHQ